ncbi:MAG TPA: sigma-70 family RNA polymerase sigma factor [Streptosporangiaceae bacterium]|nr:sigma-70 family RNA polymerase sigma factor [Streptosporangiaceae bacterium]
MITDSTEFAELTGAYRAELLAFCYRMLGSVHDAEDQVQEIMLRAWRARDGYEGRASMRTWLYRIATNTCLRALENKARRPMPSGLGDPAEGQPTWQLHEDHSVPWLQPVPDALVTEGLSDPADIAATRASVRLALIAALQYLPARQRAVLILRDVLGWHADEVAGLLGTSTVAVNSALQRARIQLERSAPAEEQLSDPEDPATRHLIDRFAAAWEAADIDGLARLLRDDASMEMPPHPLWVAGRDAVARFLGAQVLRSPLEWRLVPIAANGQPAYAVYLRRPGEDFRAHCILVLSAGPDGIGRIMSFIDAELFPVFECKDVLDVQLMSL